MSVEPLLCSKDLSKEWLQNILSTHHGSDVSVLYYTLTPPTQSQGFLSEIGFLSAEYKVKTDTKKSNLVLKFFPQDSKLLSFMQTGELANREVDFYNFAKSDVFKSVCKVCEVDHLVPKTLYCSLKGPALTIVMEDLRDFGYKMVLHRDGSTLHETMAALRSAAMVHAAGVLYKLQHGCFQVKERMNNDFYDQFLIPNLKMLANRCEDEAQSKMFLDLVPFTKQMRNFPAQWPLLDTIVHGDLWAGQTLFSADNTKTCLLDWQFCTVGNPVIDIQAMFFMSSHPDILESHLDQVLYAYWSVFKDCLVKHDVECPITYQQLVDNVESLWLYGFMFLAVSIHDFLAGNSISDKRVKGYLDFLEKRQVLTKFLKDCSQ